MIQDMLSPPLEADDRPRQGLLFPARLDARGDVPYRGPSNLQMRFASKASRTMNTPGQRGLNHSISAFQVRPIQKERVLKADDE